MKNLGLNKWNGDLSFIPCSITLCNALCGVSAIIYLIGFQGSGASFPFIAVWLIFAAMFFDVFDGFAARKLNAESLHGMQLDSLSDMVSFGVAPAMLVYVQGQAWWSTAQPGPWLAWLATGFYAACVLWRLAHYNTLALSGDESKEGFTGLPSPAAALALCSVMLLLDRLDLGVRTAALVTATYAFILGFLMVSGFEYMHFKKLLKAGAVPLRVVLLLLVVVACLRFGVFAFFALIHLYLFSGPIEWGQTLRQTIKEQNAWPLD
jgi:CDP-diacylglycerol--serine O-phosphatidyltransferase